MCPNFHTVTPQLTIIYFLCLGMIHFKTNVSIIFANVPQFLHRDTTTDKYLFSCFGMIHFKAIVFINFANMPQFSNSDTTTMISCRQIQFVLSAICFKTFMSNIYGLSSNDKCNFGKYASIITKSPSIKS